MVAERQTAMMRAQVVGRDNGDVEIYAFEPTLTSPLKLLYKKAMNECVTSVEAGFITDTTLEDIVLATYSGKVVALSQSTEDGQNIGVGTESLPGDKQLKKLQREIDSLQSRMLRYVMGWEKVRVCTPSSICMGCASSAAPWQWFQSARLFPPHCTSQRGCCQYTLHFTARHRPVSYSPYTRHREREQYSKVSEDLIAVAPTTERMKVHDKFILNPTDGTYLLSLETPMPIFTVALQSDVPVELLESPDNTVRVYCSLRHILRHTLLSVGC
jgi:hypothetical protein